MSTHEFEVILHLISRIEALDNIGDYGIGRDDDAVIAARNMLADYDGGSAPATGPATA